MCAIVGIKGESISRELYTMMVTLKHRGPDGSGVFVDQRIIHDKLDDLKIPEGNFGLGHNLLSIVGCESSQPLREDNIVLICNGEIYNYRELKKYLNIEFKSDSDCEVIIHLVKNFYHDSLKQAVLETVKYLDGDYAFAVYDSKDLVVVRDPVGVKPLYFGENKYKKFHAFASERKALWNVGIEEVETLPPGHMLYNWRMFEYDGLKTILDNKRVYKVNDIHLKDNLNNFNDTLKIQLKHYLLKAVEKRLNGLSDVGVMFSAGVDSTLLAYLSNELDVDTYLYTVGHKDSVDLKYARKTAEIMDLPLHTKTVDVEDVKYYLPLVLKSIEEFNIMKLGVGMPVYITAEMAYKDGLKVMLSGQGADELFAGYHRYLEFYKQKGEEAQADLDEDLLNLYQVNLQRDDAVAMASSVELRVPYLDMDVINMAINIPMKCKIDNYNDVLRKCILRRVALECGVPEIIVSRPKKAAQYGSGIHKILVRKVLKDESYMKTLNSLKWI
jgi:asparagine synthase (glutamine-hydrolysing)